MTQLKACISFTVFIHQTTPKFLIENILLLRTDLMRLSLAAELGNLEQTLKVIGLLPSYCFSTLLAKK
jgi:hypothetical protein